MRSRTGPGRRAATLLLGLPTGLTAALLAGCGSGATAYPPTGVDQLLIPTPSPAPADFVARVDNPWFPAVPGMRWVYRTPGVAGRTTVRASIGPVIGGVRTTALRTTRPPVDAHAAPVTTTDFYAQDRAGNVWWFGRAGVWQATGGVGAGLEMAAHPRRGDGYWMAVAGSYQVHGVVVDTDRRWRSTGPIGSVPGSSAHAVVLEVVQGDVADVETFVPGVGMVRRGETGLVSFTSPAS